MNALTTQSPQSLATNSSIALLMDPQRFDHLVRVGKMLALSPLFPAHLRGGSIEAGTANGVLVLNMANRLNEDVLTVAQNIYFVGGRPGWNTTYMIAKANQHGVFKDVIDWEVAGKGDTLKVTAFALLSGTGRRVSVTLDMETARKEGWTKNAKYQSIPEQMLRYRTAAFLIRLYCPEVMIGVPTAIELEMEARDITPDGGDLIEANDEAPIEAKAEPQKPAPKAKADPVVTKPEAQQQDATKAEPERTAAQSDLLSQEERGETVDEDGVVSTTHEDQDRFSAVLDMILAEVSSGSPIEDIEDIYGPQIEVLRGRFPDLFSIYQKAVAAREEQK